MRVGFVGLGAMGTHMARNLHRAGLLTAVWNRSADKARTLGGRTQVAAPASARRSWPPASMPWCRASPPTRTCSRSTRGLAPGLKPGRAHDRLLHRRRRDRAPGGGAARAAGVEFLDCPVSGGVEGARDATLAIMAGGTHAAFDARRSRSSRRSDAPSRTSAPPAAARPPRPPTRSCAPASSRRSRRPWPSRARRACRSRS